MLLAYADVCCWHMLTYADDKFSDATYAHHVIDFFRILGVESVKDGGAGEICCFYLDADTSSDPSLLYYLLTCFT